MRLNEARSSLAARWRGLAVAFAAGIVAVGVVGGAAGLATVVFGLYDTTASSQHTRLVSLALHGTFTNSVRRRSAGIVAPTAFTAAQVEAGFHQYEADCVMCHGGPGIARAHWVRQLEPTPPYVIDSSRHFTSAQLYFILLKGVKMSAMPAWGETRSPAELWNYVAFLDALPALSAADYARLRAAAGPAATAD